MRRVVLAFGLLVASLSAVSVVSVASVARADVPPPSDYVEQCTLEIQCKDGRACGTFHGEANPECAKAATEAGMEQRCTSWGATVGGAVFCPKGAPVPPPRAAPAKKGCGGCVAASASANGDGLVVTGVAALVIGAALARRIRRR
jgi:hypothetical protein